MSHISNNNVRDHDGHDHDHDRDHHHDLSSTIDHLTHDAYFGQEIDFVVGVTAAALTANQVFKMRSSKHHKAAHLAKAGLGAVAATTAFTMMAREHEDEKKHKALVAKHREQGLGRRGTEMVERERERPGGYVETIVDSDSDSGSVERDKNRRMALDHARPQGRSGHGSYRRRGSMYERSRTPSRSPPPLRRAVSHSPIGRREERRRDESHPRLRRFFEIVKDSLEEEYRRGQNQS